MNCRHSKDRTDKRVEILSNLLWISISKTPLSYPIRYGLWKYRSYTVYGFSITFHYYFYHYYYYSYRFVGQVRFTKVEFIEVLIFHKR